MLSGHLVLRSLIIYFYSICNPNYIHTGFVTYKQMLVNDKRTINNNAYSVELDMTQLDWMQTLGLGETTC